MSKGVLWQSFGGMRNCLSVQSRSEPCSVLRRRWCSDQDPASLATIAEAITPCSRAARSGAGDVLTWNSTHINNAEFRPKVEMACRDNGFEPPVLCTPDELMGG